ncbi:N-acetylmuramic acid 6-phosphate etherase [Microbacterium lacticum]|uniref:N-acetylmuramic acid 6-phosphate etherase n=1 Tax=Microbacterium lacticum TaxID=33885 RepID=A0A4Y3UQQ5_9MICO|nr:N-acetylmuramic acid 6-phosphate etherase [Microbacterium lacticum]TQM97969.1 N-acetylmuramic acid 6-phosphate etherase [Microbacterium lacticum]GEB95809.1 N-acetylmuramic acid 6-phosphate etherase [Microbacterium lacticum]GGI69102.1 N-acetylmuramic acid 6-phosphate etherase [Microbacterium lacticum]
MSASRPISITEQQNPRTRRLDAMGIDEFLTTMNDEDAGVADAVRAQIPQIARAVELVVSALHGGGRLIYQGAGTSGRLGVLDASECPPTFGTDPAQIIGVLAGGREAMFAAVERAEDSDELAVADLVALGLDERDVVVGIAASGRTPYVLGGLDYARRVGAATVSLACNTGAEISRHADVAIEIDNGPEVLTGSTRLKAGTSQKLVLNMISTAAMVRLGKVYGNLMVDVRPTNEKLVDRAARIVQAATDCDRATAERALAAAGNHAKTAIVSILCGIDAAAARERLSVAQGFVRDAIDGERPSPLSSTAHH